MIEHRVNIDFEYELFDPRFKASNRKYKKLCEEYEFIYFFMEKTELCLSTNRQYDQDYLYYIESIIENKIKLTDYNDNAITWWGSFEDIELEKKLNSKETSFKISEKLMILPEHSYLVKDAINWPKLNQNFKYLIKNPFMMSGRGQKQLIHSNNYNHEKLPIIIEPLHKVVADYGLRIDFQKGLKYFVQLYNINGKQFSGGKIIKVIPKQNSIDLESLIKKITDEFLDIGCKESIQIDCYQHQDGFRYLCEANHRKTMGDLIFSLHESFDPELKGKGLYVENKYFNSFKDIKAFLGTKIFTLDKKKGIIPCSPPGNLKTWFYEVE